MFNCNKHLYVLIQFIFLQVDSGFSLEDKKRHQVLTKLWSELKGTEVTPSKLLDALTAVDSALWVPPQRPVSLNLQLPIIQATKYRKSKPLLGILHLSSDLRSFIFILIYIIYFL